MTGRVDDSRRRFLQAGAVAGAGMLMAAGCGPANNTAKPGNGAGNQPGNDTANVPENSGPERLDKRGIVVGGGQLPGSQFFVGIVDLDAASPSTRHPQDVGFLGHGFTPRIGKPHIVMITEKHGAGCVEYDLKAGKVLRRVQAGVGREFYGHSAFSPDAKLWYCTEAETEDGSYDGVLAVRDADSLELRDETFRLRGMFWHEDDGAFADF